MMRYPYTFNRKTETKFTGAWAGVCGELGHSTSNFFPTGELLGQRITVLEGLKEGDVGKKRQLFLSSSMSLPCFCAQFRYCLLSPGFYSSCEGKFACGHCQIDISFSGEKRWNLQFCLLTNVTPRLASVPYLFPWELRFSWCHICQLVLDCIPGILDITLRDSHSH